MIVKESVFKKLFDKNKNEVREFVYSINKKLSNYPEIEINYEKYKDNSSDENGKKNITRRYYITLSIFDEILDGSQIQARIDYSEKCSHKEMFLRNCRNEDEVGINLSKFKSDIGIFLKNYNKLLDIKSEKHLSLHEIRNLSKNIKRKKLSEAKGSTFIKNYIKKKYPELNISEKAKFSIDRSMNSGIKGLCMEFENKSYYYNPTISHYTFDLFRHKNLTPKYIQEIKNTISLEKFLNHSQNIENMNQQIKNRLENIFNKKLKQKEENNYSKNSSYEIKIREDQSMKLNISLEMTAEDLQRLIDGN